MTARRLRIGVMGGTFDPIHHGHLVAASEAADAFDLDEVIFVPTGNPGNKKVISSSENRYLMTVIATAANPRFKVSRVDIDRPGVTYTIDTLTELSRQYPDADLFFISGADAIAQILAWKEVDSIWPLAHFVAVTRPGHKLELPDVKEAKISQLEVPALAISSTAIRERAEAGKPIWYLVPDGVVQYIAKHKLYRGHGDSVHN
ncbi:MAG: nicotinate-nucleotide adenylyltransferase [Aquiluna sp.]|jgi:nicotinate-nucleotide adenylyltransferase